MKVCEREETEGCSQQTCVAPDGAFDREVLGQDREVCWGGCDQSPQGSLEHWSWENCSVRSSHLEVNKKKSKNNNSYSI